VESRSESTVEAEKPEAEESKPAAETVEAAPKAVEPAAKAVEAAAPEVPVKVEAEVEVEALVSADVKDVSEADVADDVDVASEKSALLREAEHRLGETHEESGPELIEKVVNINRCAKVVKGGRRFSFSALVVCGDQQGQVGFGFGKANQVADCIRKASESSKHSMVKVAVTNNTIPHEVMGEFGGGKVLLRPASPGTGIIAGGGVRAVVEAAGIKDVLAKSLGSNNHFNVVKATIAALQNLRTREQIYLLRGKKPAEKKAI
jgi:small subunit ribosomal protein S5